MLLFFLQIIKREASTVPLSYMYLNSVSSQCARGKSSIARKPEDHPNILSGKKTFQKYNPPDFKFYLSKLTNKIFPHMV